jgi:hypothetical protein
MLIQYTDIPFTLLGMDMENTIELGKYTNSFTPMRHEPQIPFHCLYLHLHIYIYLLPYKWIPGEIGNMHMQVSGQWEFPWFDLTRNHKSQ